jgi:hypothetical protein
MWHLPRRCRFDVKYGSRIVQVDVPPEVMQDLDQLKEFIKNELGLSE